MKSDRPRDVAAAAEAAESKEWYSTKEAAAELGASVWSVRSWIRDGKLIADGATPGQYRIHRDAIERFRRTKWQRGRRA